MEEKNTKIKHEEPVKFKGKYIPSVGKRKTAIAQVRLFKNGNGLIMVNNQKINRYFTPDKVSIITQPLKLTKLLRDYNFSVLVKGGGVMSQAEAVRHGIARALVAVDKDLKPVLRSKDWITRDARKKERKKPGLKGARRAPQWSKR